MADALDKIRAGIDKKNAKLAANRLGGREHDVTLRSYTVTSANPDAGIPGTKVAVDTLLSPRPSVELRDVRGLGGNGEVEIIGDAAVSGISRLNHTAEQLAEATDWIIKGDAYSLVQGHLKEKPLEFTAVLKKRR